MLYFSQAKGNFTEVSGGYENDAETTKKASRNQATRKVLDGPELDGPEIF